MRLDFSVLVVIVVVVVVVLISSQVCVRVAFSVYIFVSLTKIQFSFVFIYNRLTVLGPARRSCSNCQLTESLFKCICMCVALFIESNLNINLNSIELSRLCASGKQRASLIFGQSDESVTDQLDFWEWKLKMNEFECSLSIDWPKKIRINGIGDQINTKRITFIFVVPAELFHSVDHSNGNAERKREGGGREARGRLA